MGFDFVSGSGAGVDVDENACADLRMDMYLFLVLTVNFGVSVDAVIANMFSSYYVDIFLLPFTFHNSACSLVSSIAWLIILYTWTYFEITCRLFSFYLKKVMVSLNYEKQEYAKTMDY